MFFWGLEDSNHTQFNASFKKAVMCKMNQLMKLKVVSIVEIKSDFKTCSILLRIDYIIKPKIH